MKPYWFKLTENDQPIPIKPKTYKVATLLGGVLIGVMGSYFLIPSKVVDNPISVVEPVQTIKPGLTTITPVVPAIKNPMLNPSGNDEEEDESEDEDDD